MSELYAEYGLPDIAAKIKVDTVTEAFTALVVDTGLVGLLLLVANFGLVALQVLRNKADRYRYVLLTSVLVLFLWMFVINLLDITLFYLAVMPSGLLLLMARPSEEVLAESVPQPSWRGGLVGSPARPVGDSSD